LTPTVQKFDIFKLDNSLTTKELNIVLVVRQARGNWTARMVF